MIKKLIIIVLLTACINSQDIVTKDSNGCIVLLKEKYGGFIIDSSVTIVMRYNGTFVLVHKDKPSSYYNESNYSLVSVERKK